MLRDELLTRIQTKNVKIGTKDGSGFFYCGPLTDFLADLDGWETKLFEQLKKAVALSEKQLRSAVNTLPEPKAYAERMIRERMQPFNLTLQGYLNLLQDGFANVNRKKKSLDAASLALKKRKDLRKRHIEETYPSQTEKHTTIVIIEGSERGLYWTIKEFEEGISGEDNEGGTGKDDQVAEDSE